MQPINLQDHRQSGIWYIRESEHCIFHLHPSLVGDAQLGDIMACADRRIELVSEALNLDVTSIKARERQPKANYWFYSAQVLEGCDFISRGAERDAGFKFFYAEVNTSGIHCVNCNTPWQECVCHFIHEETHLVWMRAVGEAPPLLNEGVATYIEAVIGDAPIVTTQDFKAAWLERYGSRPGFLRSLSTESAFWKSRESGMPSYRLGATLVWYLLDERGTGLLQDIFRESHYRDDRLADILETKTGVSLEGLESRITAWLQHKG